MLKRTFKVFIVLAALSAAGIIYYLFASHGHSLPCIFYELTGFYCPGCGATRMCRKLMQLDFYGAFRANQVSVFAVPFLGAVFARRIYLYIRYGKPKKKKWMDIGAVIAIIALLIFGVLRNIPYFDFLRPM